VPTLIIPDKGKTFALSQSNAIVLYAAETGPNRLIPQQDPLARALTLERFFFFVTDVIALSHAAWALRPQSPSPAIQALNERAVTALLSTEKYVETSPFMAGDAFSIADIAAFTIADFMRDTLDWDAHPHFSRWFQAISMRPAVMRGQAAFLVADA
jgi:GST-like protein